MDAEKDFLKRDLEKAESEEEIKQLTEDAEMLGHEDVVELAKQKLEAISAKAKSVETTTPSQISQVESMGGSIDEVKKRTENVDAEIEAVKKGAEEKIAEVKSGQNPEFEQENMSEEEVVDMINEFINSYNEKSSAKDRLGASMSAGNLEGYAKIATRRGIVFDAEKVKKIMEDAVSKGYLSPIETSEETQKIPDDDKLIITEKKLTPSEDKLNYLKKERLAQTQNRVMSVDLDKIATNPDLLKQIDWTNPQSFTVAGELLDRKLISSKELVRVVSSADLETLDEMSTETLAKLKELEPVAFGNALITLVDKNAQERLMDRSRGGQMSLLMRLVKLPGGVQRLRGLGTDVYKRIFEVRDRFIEQAKKDPYTNVVGESSGSLKMMFDSVKNLSLKREDIVGWLKQGMASDKANPFIFKEGVNKILDLVNTGKISQEEADDIIKNNPNFEKYIK